MKQTDVSVLGLGNMGRALAEALLGAGNSVTVWNRTTSRTAPLAERGAQVASGAGEAIAASPATIACVLRYEHLYESLEGVASEAYAERTLINLTWGSPEDATEMSEWMQSRGAAYLDGGIPVIPSGIGRPDTELVYSGPTPVWNEVAPLLKALGGRSRLVGERPADANVVALAIPGLFYNLAYEAFFEAAAFAASYGVEPAALAPLVETAVQQIDEGVAEAMTLIGEGNYGAEQASIAVQLDAMVTARDALHASGQRASMTGALVEILDRAVAAGHADDGCAAVFPMLRDGG